MTQVNPEARAARKVANIKEIFNRPREPNVIAIRASWISFGGTAAIVTSMGLILGLDAAESSRQSIVSALLIVALADNLSDSLSVLVISRWLGTWIAGGFA